jgi:carbamoyltransferase
MRILGISAHYHDSAAALVIDGLPVGAVEEERLSRKKGDASFPLRAIDWCLESAGVRPEELDAVVFYEKPMRKVERIITTALRSFPHSWPAFPKAVTNAFGEKLWVKGTIAAQLGVPGTKILFTEHHQAHAAAAFLTSPSDDAAILTVDGVGEWATLTIGRGTRSGGHATIELFREVRFPHSLGMFYSTFTAWLGFPINEGEFKVMGLAAYGKPAMEREVRRVLRRTEDGAFELDLQYFDFHAGAKRSFSRRFIDAFGEPRAPHGPLDPATAEGAHYADVARSVQVVLEDTLVDLARTVRRETGARDLCIGGGVALNGCANARILGESGFDRVFVPYAPGDGGSALGAALYADRAHFAGLHREVPDHPYWGPEADAAELVRLAREDDLPFEVLDGDDAVAESVANEIAAGRIVGWMNGRTELGPRALGNRSILAAPGPSSVRDRLNRSIKFREEFRPFAPAVPIEDAATFFDLPSGGERLGRFMSSVFPMKPEFRERLGAVAHVDGSSRVQTVDRTMAPRFWCLLRAVERKIGVPIVLNTSFNLAGEPIVSSAVEGYSTFQRSGIDLLVGGNTIVRKREQSPC